jgi:hypothetical protein
MDESPANRKYSPAYQSVRVCNFFANECCGSASPDNIITPKHPCSPRIAWSEVSITIIVNNCRGVPPWASPTALPRGNPNYARLKMLQKDASSMKSIRGPPCSLRKCIS